MTVMAILAVGLLGCEVPENGGSSRPPAEQAAIDAVKATVRSEVWVSDWQCGPMFDGGFGVMGEGDGAYWVDPAGKVWAANGTAKTWSPDVPYAKAGVDIDSVHRAVKGLYRD